MTLPSNSSLGLFEMVEAWAQNAMRAQMSDLVPAGPDVVPQVLGDVDGVFLARDEFFY